LLDDEPRFAGGAEISLAYAHLSLVFDKAIRAYSLTCDDEDGEAVRLYVRMSSSELHTLQRAFAAAAGKWSTFVIWGEEHLHPRPGRLPAAV